MDAVPSKTWEMSAPQAAAAGLTEQGSHGRGPGWPCMLRGTNLVQVWGIGGKGHVCHDLALFAGRHKLPVNANSAAKTHAFQCLPGYTTADEACWWSRVAMPVWHQGCLSKCTRQLMLLPSTCKPGFAKKRVLNASVAEASAGVIR